MKKRKWILVVLILMVAITILFLHNKKEELVTGIAYYVGENDKWHISYEYDHDRYEIDHINYITMTYKGKNPTLNIDYINFEMISTDVSITGSLGHSSYRENFNEKGQREITFLIGTVTEVTDLNDQYTFIINYSTPNGKTIDTIILKEK